jgi:3-oxoacyl-[acyl-carrier-protein] synthase-1
MKRVWVVHDTIISALGNSTAENYEAIQQGRVGVQSITDNQFSDISFYGSRLDGRDEVLPHETFFEWLCQHALNNVLSQLEINTRRTLFILSTTKGNVDQRGVLNPLRVALHETAYHIQHKFSFQKGLVVSNACISGVLSLIVAKRYLQAGLYDHAIVLGADVLSKFVVTGFQSLHALSQKACRPFDEMRDGINLGECAAITVLSVDKGLNQYSENIYLAGGGLTNDANHISGPSRTGQELATAIQLAIMDSTITTGSIDFVNAHGTGTRYNDDMESKALYLAGLQDTPTNSLKGYLGHTLGAAGIVESNLMIASMLNQTSIISQGFESCGVPHTLSICQTKKSINLNYVLKTASGFGGCNAALVIAKA